MCVGGRRAKARKRAEEEDGWMSLVNDILLSPSFRGKNYSPTDIFSDQTSKL